MKRSLKRLERIERLRKLQESIQRAQWGLAEGEARDHSNRAHEINMATDATREHLSEGFADGTIDAGGVCAHDPWLSHLDQSAASAQLMAMNARQLADDLRAQWLVARREQRAVEQLATRERGRQEEESERQQAREIDEIASIRDQILRGTDSVGPNTVSTQRGPE